MQGLGTAASQTACDSKATLDGTSSRCTCPVAPDMAGCDTAGVLTRQDANVGACLSSFGSQHREFHTFTWTDLQIPHTVMTMDRCACGTHEIH